MVVVWDGFCCGCCVKVFDEKFVGWWVFCGLVDGLDVVYVWFECVGDSDVVVGVLIVFYYCDYCVVDCYV